MSEIVGAFGGGGGNRTQSEAPIPEQDQGPASAGAGTEAVLEPEPSSKSAARHARELLKEIDAFGKRQKMVQLQDFLAEDSPYYWLGRCIHALDWIVRELEKQS